jgi:hypothetical protein
MKVLVTFVILAAIACSVASGAESVWKDGNGKPMADEPSRKSVSGFGGWLVVTPDTDWEAKWKTPRDVTPAFTTSDEVHVGETLTILIFYVGPRDSAGGTIDIRCDLKVTRPDGSASVDEKGLACGTGSLQGPASDLRLSELIVQYVGEPGDPLGLWTVEVTLRDANAEKSVSLRTGFTLKSADATSARLQPTSRGASGVAGFPHLEIP